MKKILCLFLILVFGNQMASAGLLFVRSSGITLTGADGITLTGADGITLTGADGVLSQRSNGITLTGADGITLTGADGLRSSGVNGTAFTGTNGITLTGADGITLTGADGITLTGADGITLTGADGTRYTANSIVVRKPNGITLTGADGITLTGADGITLTGADGISRTGVNGITLTGADGITLTGADGITLTGADGITLTGADSFTGIGTQGVLFENSSPSGITLTGADGITLTGADGITLTGADGITLTGADSLGLNTASVRTGIQSIDPELAIALNNATDDRNINALAVYHDAVTDTDIEDLRTLGFLGGTRFRKLPAVYLSGTRDQFIALSHLPRIRSLQGNRTLDFNSDPYFARTGIQRVAADTDLTANNGGTAVNGNGVTVAVLDTGINSQHADLAGKVVQNVRLADAQSSPAGFVYPLPLENISNTDLVSGHGTFVGSIIAGSGSRSAGKFAGVAAGAKLLGLSAGDASLMHVLAGFDYLLDKGATYGVRVVNCSFSANTVYDPNDAVNVATRMLVDRGVNIVFSAGNSGSGNGTLNPYAMAPWVVSVGATDADGRLASFSSRGNFGDELQHPTLVAPGVNIAGARSTASISSVGGVIGSDSSRLSASELSYYMTGSGTSFSAPQAAGAIAMMLQANPSLTPVDIKDILSRTATPLPKYFYHEAGAGMLNTHAAVLEAAFPERRMGTFRSVLSRNGVKFETRTHQLFGSSIAMGETGFYGIDIPANTVLANVGITWGFGVNDFGLKVYSPQNSLAGQSNGINLTGITGRREKVALRMPAEGSFTARVAHSLPAGTAQQVFGSVDVTQVIYPNLSDLDGLSEQSVAAAEASLVSNVMLPEGKKFRPDSVVSRIEMAEAVVRAGLVPQYVSGTAMYIDVRDKSSRAIVESVQSNPSGSIFDAASGGRFYPFSNVSKLAAAIALVRAAGLESRTSSATLTASDSSSIPSQFRGYAAVAIQYGLISLDGTAFNGERNLTRLELAKALVAINE